jgi:hypothetical protein
MTEGKNGLLLERGGASEDSNFSSLTITTSSRERCSLSPTMARKSVMLKQSKTMPHSSQAACGEWRSTTVVHDRKQKTENRSKHVSEINVVAYMW